MQVSKNPGWKIHREPVTGRYWFSDPFGGEYGHFWGWPTREEAEQALNDELRVRCVACGEIEGAHCEECSACPEQHAGWCSFA